jgi:hypothetical protein
MSEANLEKNCCGCCCDCKLGKDDLEMGAVEK